VDQPRPATAPAGLTARLDVRRLAFTLLLCCLPLLLYAPFIAEPFERDEGIYATIAQGLRNGRLPYRDFYEFKPPLIYGWYALSFALFGEDVASPRLFAAASLAITTLLVVQAGRLLLGERRAYFTGGLFALSTGLAWLQFNANTEVFMLPFLAASLAAFAAGQRSGSAAWFVVAGATGGLAIMTKQVAAWNLLALAGAGLWLARRNGLTWRAALRPVAWLGLGWAATTLLVLLPFALTGTLGDFYEVCLRYGWLYTSKVALVTRLGGLGRLSLQLLATAPLVVAAAIGARGLIRASVGGPAVVLLAWSAGSVLGVASSGRFFPHYFVHLLPALALLAAPAVDDAWRRLRAGWRPSRPAVAAWALLSLPMLWFHLGVYLNTTPEGRHLAKFPDAQARVSIQSRDLAAYVRGQTRPDEAVLNWGRESQLYFYAGRRPASRFLYDRPFWLDPPTFEAAMRELRAAPPALILDSLPPPGLDEPYEQYHPPAFLAFLAERYDYLGRVEFAEVYRLKGTSPP
jgi:4-amino-4-deoxy-L-arabinose transferase-like glycosyltransferase